MVECLGQERETFQLLPCGWATHSPLPPPPDMSSPVSCPLLLAQAVAARAISHPQSGAGTGRPLNTGCLVCPQEHSLLIVWRELQVCSRLPLKPSACHLAWIVTIVRPQQPFVSDSLSLSASQTSPTPPWGFALRRVQRLRRVGESTGLGVQRPQNVTSSL